MAVRGYFGGVTYAWNGGKLKRQGQLDVPLQGQGESVTYSRDGSKIMYGSEGAESGVEAEDFPSYGKSGDSDSASSNGSSASGGEGGGGSEGNVRTGAIAVGVLFVAYLGFKRLRRRSS